jgi:hypothetical protein
MNALEQRGKPQGEDETIKRNWAKKRIIFLSTTSNGGHYLFNIILDTFSIVMLSSFLLHLSED